MNLLDRFRSLSSRIRLGEPTDLESWRNLIVDAMMAFAAFAFPLSMVVTFNDIVEKTSGLFGRTKKEIRMHRTQEPDIRAVDVDRGQIEQVLLNLYVNAAHAMPAGGDLYVQTQDVTLDQAYVKPDGVASGEYVKISVTDTGMGMDEATQQRIFEPFFSTKEMGRGTGLGLAFAYGIIKNHGGLIRVRSEKGRGTTFNLYLPASQKAVQREEPRPSEVLRGTETILLVDDEAFIIDIGVEMLKALGYEVLIAKSGRKAMDLYRESSGKIDMVILDMIMPDMGGGVTYDRLRAIDPQVKVLLSSGYSVNGQASEILKRGCDGFIQKPFNLKDLAHKLREVLDKTGVRVPPPKPGESTHKKDAPAPLER
jgi:CheY-like chemotaxis protein